MNNCKVCSLPTETLNLVHRLRFETGLSYRVIAEVVNRDHLTEGETEINNVNLSNHFRKHVSQEEALAQFISPDSSDSPGTIPEPISPDFFRDRAILFEKQARVLDDLEKRFKESRERLDLSPNERKGIFTHLALSKEIRMAILALAQIQNPGTLIEQISLSFLDRKTNRSMEILSRWLSTLRDRILPCLREGVEHEVDDLLRDMVGQIVRYEEQETEQMKSELRRAFGLAGARSPE